MTFAEHIRDSVFHARLKDKRILVVFDPARRYHEICLSLANEHCTVVDAGNRPLSSRLDAMKVWQSLCEDTSHQSQLLIYVPEEAPVDNAAKRVHPFTAFIQCGTLFPRNPRDDYQQLCYSYCKDRRKEIDQLFAAGEPPILSHIDSLQDGANAIPRLKGIFGTGEFTKILSRFLAPSSEIEQNLTESSDWVTEFRSLTQRTIEFQFDSRATKPPTIREKLWQYLLFSEFAHDLPSDLPEGLSHLPKASGSATSLVIELCDELRKNDDTKESYRDEANRIQEELKLEEECASLNDLGERDTFAFEEARFLNKAVTAINAGSYNIASEILETHRHSLWTEEGERRLLWKIVELSLRTFHEIEATQEKLKQVPGKGSDLCQFYQNEFSRVDRYHREFEQAIDEIDQASAEVEKVADKVHSQYRVFFNQLQDRLLTEITSEGWPFEKVAANATLFDRLVRNYLNEGKRVAYLMVDALRLELAQQLEYNLSQSYETKLELSAAQLPCVTRFGMAALLPEADTKLQFRSANGKLEPFHGDTQVTTRSARLDVIHKAFGERFREMRMDDFLKNNSKETKRKALKKECEKADLLVITSTELDEAGESSLSLRNHLRNVLRQIHQSIEAAAQLDYDIAIVATDHGFIWLDELDAGSTISKPSGKWLLDKRRCLIGSGDEAPDSIRLVPQAISLPTEEPYFIAPRKLAVYRKGSEYFHEGLSLQESLVSSLEVHLGSNKSQHQTKKLPELDLTRKRNKVSGRIVAVNLSWPGSASLLDESTQFLLVALQDGEVVGTPSSNEAVDSSTGLVRIAPGNAIKVSLRLTDEAKEGPIKIRVRDVKTERDVAKLDLVYEPTI
ncbi:PglZ domain-containing protein [Roseibacillus ishigakijimensis]|nr:PglZ domain-containing protein [Roseibacillus ishigakijimensis]